MTNLPTDIPTIKMSEVVPLAVVAYKCGIRNIGLLGPSGIGKTEVVAQIAEALTQEMELDYDAKCIMFRAGHKGLVDMGVPVPDHDIKRTRTYTPLAEDLPDEERDGKVGVWCLDEGNSMPKQLQGPLFGMVQDRYLGETKFPRDFLIVLTGNRIEDMGVANKLAAPLNDRLCFFNVEPDVPSFKDYLVNAQVPNAALLAGFLEHRPMLLHCAPGKSVADSKTDYRYTMPKDARSFPTPRSIVKIAQTLNLPQKFRQPIVSGQCGTAFSSELEDYLEVAVHLPSTEEVLADPEGCRLPDESKANSGVKYAMTCKLAFEAEVDTVNAFATYVKRIGREFQALYFADIARRDKTLLEQGAYVDTKRG